MLGVFTRLSPLAAPSTPPQPSGESPKNTAHKLMALPMNIHHREGGGGGRFIEDLAKKIQVLTAGAVKKLSQFWYSAVRSLPIFIPYIYHSTLEFPDYTN